MTTDGKSSAYVDEVKCRVLEALVAGRINPQGFIRGPGFNWHAKVAGGLITVDLGDRGKMTFQLVKTNWAAPQQPLPPGKRLGFCNDTGCPPCNELVPTHLVEGDCPGIARCIGCGEIPYPVEAGKLRCRCFMLTGDPPTFSR